MVVALVGVIECVYFILSPFPLANTRLEVAVIPIFCASTGTGSTSPTTTTRGDTIMARSVGDKIIFTVCVVREWVPLVIQIRLPGPSAAALRRSAVPFFAG